VLRSWRSAERLNERLVEEVMAGAKTVAFA